MQGRRVELVVYRGQRDDRGPKLGALNFERVEWEAFRHMVVAGMRAAGYARVPIQLEDGTRREPQPVN